MTLQTLASQELSILVMPENGGAITQATFNDRKFLATPPRASIAPKHLGLESDWVAAWNGGWQPLLPNAGAEFFDGKYPQGFHGNASQASWNVMQQSADAISLEWSGENLASKRTIQLDKNSISLSGSLINHDVQERSVIVTEHLVLGSDFLESEISIEPIGQARFRELEYDGSAQGRDFLPWDSFHEKKWATVTSDTPARMGVFSEISCIKVSNEIFEIEISWDAHTLPFLWIWQELGYTQEHPWNGEYWALGVEPSSSADGMGIGGNSVRKLKSNEELMWSVNLKIQKRAGK